METLAKCLQRSSFWPLLQRVSVKIRRLLMPRGAQVKVQSYSKINNMGHHPKDRHCHRCGEPFAAGAMLYTAAVYRQRYRNRIRT
jgi:hypothetical protein